MEDSSEREEASISVKVGREALVIARNFLEQREFTTENDIRYMRNIQCVTKKPDIFSSSLNACNFCNFFSNRML